MQLLVERLQGSVAPVTWQKGSSAPPHLYGLYSSNRCYDTDQTQGSVPTAQYLRTNNPEDLLADRSGEEAKQGKQGKKATTLHIPFQRSLGSSFSCLYSCWSLLSYHTSINIQHGPPLEMDSCVFELSHLAAAS